MGEPSPSAALRVLSDVYRERRTGLLTVGEPEARVQLTIRDGHIVGIVPPDPSSWESESLRARPDDSARLKLERVLAEVGLSEKKPDPKPKEPDTGSIGVLRDRLLAALAGGSAPAEFQDQEDLPRSLAVDELDTEPLLLEAIRRLEAEVVRAYLGDLDRRLVVALAPEERTLTPSEGYILSRIDGQSSIREVLQVVPFDPDETERTVLGLLLGGRVATEAPRIRPTLRFQPRPEPDETDETDQADEAEPRSEHIPLDLDDDESADGEGGAPAPAVAAAEIAEEDDEDDEPADDPEVGARRREILEVFQGLPLRNHFEVLGLEPGCSDEDVRRAHRVHVKRYHPDMQRDPRLADLHDILEAIFIRVGEAWEVLGNAKSRASYEARLGVKPRVVVHPPSGGQAGSNEPPVTDALLEAAMNLSLEDTLIQAKRLLREKKEWDAIRFLEAAMPRLQPRRQEHRGRILLAKAYSKYPDRVRKAEETLQAVVREDPANVEAHFELGMLYKARKLTARAQTQFRKVVELNPDHKQAATEVGGPEPSSEGFFRRLFKKRGGGSR